MARREELWPQKKFKIFSAAIKPQATAKNENVGSRPVVQKLEILNPSCFKLPDGKP